MVKPYGFPLCIQLPAVPDYFAPSFREVLAQLQRLRFAGVELNIIDYSEPALRKLASLLSDYDLKLTMIATGSFAKTNGLTLSGSDEAVREKSVAMVMDSILPAAALMRAGVICGFIKGVAGEDATLAENQMRKSISTLEPVCEKQGIDLYLEATNHYEATLVNQVSDGVAFSNNCLRVLPDTYHMNIEEPSMAGALLAYRDYYRNLHISDNNRYFTGFGAIDFFQIFALLKSMDYEGTVTIEGRWNGSLQDSIAFSAAYIRNVAERLEIL